METLTASVNLAQKRRIVTVEAPEWDLKVRLRELGSRQLKDWDDDDRSKVLSLMIIDDDGNLVYKTPEDMENLREMPAILQRRLLEAAADLNKKSPEAVEDIIKNSAADPKPASESA